MEIYSSRESRFFAKRKSFGGKLKAEMPLLLKLLEHIEEYKPYLHHFSIGKLNRLGVSQYRIEKGEERAQAELKI